MNSLPTRSVAIVRLSTAALAFLTLVPCLTAATKKDEHPPEISYDAASMEADVKTHVLHFKDVTITYGKMTVRADRALATASDFKNSRWTFAGNVRINADPRGNLRSDEAVVEFEDNQLRRATATGTPAEFDQKREDSNVIARGHANQIVYDVGPGTVRLSDDAWVTDGHNDTSAPVIVYSLREEHVEATTSPDAVTRVHGTVPSPGDTRIHVTLDPNGPKADGTNKPKPADGAKVDGGKADAGKAAGAKADGPKPEAAQATVPQ